MSVTTIPGGHGQPPITLTIAGSVSSYAYSTIAAAIKDLVAVYESTHDGHEPTIIVYDPVTGGSTVEGGAKDVPNALYLENFTPIQDTTYRLGLKASGLILSGSESAAVFGRAGANELIVGNGGNDSIHGHGGTGTIIAGGGSNHIHSGHGNMMVMTGTGNDTIHTGSGTDTVMTYGNATLFAGSGNTTFYDMGKSADVIAHNGNATLYAGSGFDDFTGGSGFTIMHSGTGADTFSAGSGLNLMNDDGKGAPVTFEFDQGVAGSSIVTGFNLTSDSIQLSGFTAAQFMADVTLAGGNSYVNLGDGTKIVFVGVDIKGASVH